jgi:hypothetical protein
MGITIKAIQPDAHFLFTRLAKLTLLAIEIYLDETIMRTVNIFERVSSLQSELFVELKLLRTRVSKPGQKRLTLGDRIGMARKRLDALNMTGFLQEPIEDLFFLKSNKDGRMPRIIELNLFGYVTDTLTNPKLFELVPSLQKLNLGRNLIKSLTSNVFEHAGNLLELDLTNIKNRIKLKTDTFHSLVNLRVLRLTLGTLDSLEPFNCLCNLEELTLCVKKGSPLGRLDAFSQQLSKLRVLELDFRCKFGWIPPTAFDRLTCLERFEFKCLKCNLNGGLEMQPLEIGIAPRSLKVVGVKTLHLQGGASSIANIETLELFHIDPALSRKHGVQLTKLKSDWPLCGLKRLSATPFDEKSLSFKQMVNLEILSLQLVDFGVFSRCEFGCLSTLRELNVNLDNKSM